MSKNIVIFYILTTINIYATGGYDNGSAVGDGNLGLDFTLNPMDIVPYGQSYVTWNYGLSSYSSFHGYLSHEAKDGDNQIYYGLKYTFFENKNWDLATAFGFRDRKSKRYIYMPQLLYTYKLLNGYDIGGSVVSVYNMSQSDYLGTTYDIAFRFPIEFNFLKKYAKDIKFALGAFRSASGRLHPTYSIDFRF
jgi:hypothetical protein